MIFEDFSVNPLDFRSVHINNVEDETNDLKKVFKNEKKIYKREITLEKIFSLIMYCKTIETKRC